MKLSIASAIAIAALGTASVSAIADDRPELKGPAQTMGDEGKLPASDTMRNATPDMTGPSTGAATGDSAGTAGTGLRMGDEAGKLPATGTVSGKVPEMRGPTPDEK